MIKNNLVIKKNFKWNEINYGDVLSVDDNGFVDKYMAIQDSSGRWYELMYLTREECEYMPIGISYPRYSYCIKHSYPDSEYITITIEKSVDKENAIKFAYKKKDLNH